MLVGYARWYERTPEPRMADIEAKLNEFGTRTGKCYVHLDSDKTLAPWKSLIPITWSGFVCGEKVEIVQTDMFAGSLDSFEFRSFPSRFEHLKGEIIHLIDQKLRTLD